MGAQSSNEEAPGLTRREVLTGLAAAGIATLGSGTAAFAAPTPTPSGTTPTPTPAASPAKPKFGFVLATEQFLTTELVQLAMAAEQAGFDELWLSDQFQPWQDNQGHAMAPWLTLAVLGVYTKRVALGTSATCPLFRHPPSQVAQAFASLGVLFPGRIFLGLGTGAAVNELAATGQFPAYPERAERWVEAVRVIRQLWTGNYVQVPGKYYQVPVAKLYDVPSPPAPIYMAASGINSARLAGQHGDGWVTRAADLAAQPKLLQAFREGATAVGKSASTLPVRVTTFVVVGGTKEATYAAERWRFLPGAFTKEFIYAADPRTIQQQAKSKYSIATVTKSWVVDDEAGPHIKAIQKLLAQGVTHVAIQSGQADQQTVIEFYGTKVLPQLR